jgi:hypothetical protein
MALTPFQREYAAARRKWLQGEGPATFDFGGTQYSVASKEDVRTAKDLRRAAADETGRFMSRRADDDSMRYRGQRQYFPTPEKPKVPTPEQLAQYEKMSRPGRDAIEGVYPELALIPGGKAVKEGLGALRGAMARRAAAKEAARPRRVEPKDEALESFEEFAKSRSTMRREPTADEFAPPSFELRKGGKVKAYAKGGVTRADGCAQRGRTKGRYI